MWVHERLSSRPQPVSLGASAVGSYSVRVADSVGGASELGIVIPAWNAAAVLPGCLDHLLRLLDEADVAADVLVIDDGSQDGTPDIARAYGDRVRVHTVAHGGVSAARNAGLRSVRSPLVAMLDADDQFAPAMFAELLPRARDRSSAPIVQGLILDWYPDAPDVDQGRAPSPLMTVAGKPYRSIVFGAAIYRSEVFTKVGFLNESYARHEDYDWFLRAYDQRVPKDNVDVVSLHYRRRSDGLSETAEVGDPTRARIHGAAIRRRRDGLVPIPEGFPTPEKYFGSPPTRAAADC